MSGAVFLKGENVTLRTIEEEDLDFWRDNMNHPSIWRPMLHNEPRNKDQIREWFESLGDSDDIYLMIYSGEEPVGRIWTHNMMQGLGRAEIGIWVGKDHHRDGYGTEASRIFAEYLFNQLRTHKVVARSYDFNEASTKLWKKLGFEHEATLKEEFYIDGEYVDVKYFGITEEEWRSK